MNNTLKIPNKYKKDLSLLMKMQEEEPVMFKWFESQMDLYINGKLSHNHMKKLKDLPTFDAYMWLIYSD